MMYNSLSYLGILWLHQQKFQVLCYPTPSLYQRFPHYVPCDIFFDFKWNCKFIRFNIDALQFFHVKDSVTWFSIAMNWKVILAFSNVHWRDTSFLNNLLTPWITLVQLNYLGSTNLKWILYFLGQYTIHIL